MNTPVLSIIIPCYNSGKYLPDALASIKEYTDKTIYEVIIINDGSTDDFTLTLLEQLPPLDYHVLNQENKGPAAARNAGVKVAKGEYLLFLDSDNKIRKEYITKGIGILNAQPEVSIVYGKPAFFGDTTEPRFYTGEFNMTKMLKGNYIDMCSVIRKKAWEALNGQDEHRLIIEDWDFWIRAGAAGYKFHYIDETLFDYRILYNSFNKQYAAADIFDPIIKYLYSKHANLIFDHYRELYQQYYFYKEDQQQPFRSFLKYFHSRYIKKE